MKNAESLAAVEKTTLSNKKTLAAFLYLKYKNKAK